MTMLHDADKNMPTTNILDIQKEIRAKKQNDKSDKIILRILRKERKLQDFLSLKMICTLFLNFMPNFPVWSVM